MTFCKAIIRWIMSQTTDVGVKKAADGPLEVVLGRLSGDVHSGVWSSGRPSGEVFAGSVHLKSVHGLTG